jgi:phenylglyoxylate dehydrogenase epsilon subunit
MYTNYLIIGASHAGLSALDAIRRCDPDAAVTVISAENTEPYSPTALPYVISGKTQPERTGLRKSDYFENLGVDFINGVSVTRVNTTTNEVMLVDGRTIGYKKLLVASGASALIPEISGIDEVDFASIRTMADAQRIQKQSSRADSAVIVGAGFIGMHTAESLFKSGLKVSVIEAFDQVMPTSFDPQASELIKTIFVENGISILTGKKVTKLIENSGKKIVVLDDGETVSGDMLVISTGIKPNIDFLAESGIDCKAGVIVDKRMRTSVPNVWAAGDVASCSQFFSQNKSIGGTIPCATEQGRTAGMDMVEDRYAREYPGNLNMNTFGFFDNFAFSIGKVTSDASNAEVAIQTDAEKIRFSRFTFEDDVLTGVSAINKRLDPGILKELILRRTDLSSRKNDFIKAPLETGRQVMRELF